MRIDFYVCTARLPAFDLIPMVCKALGGTVEPVEAPKHARQYQHAVQFRNVSSERVDGIARWGGNGGGVNLDFSGEPSAVVGDWLRENYPSHHAPSRMDVCEDLLGPGLFDAIFEFGRDLAQRSSPRIQINRQGDWDDLERGRTVEFGSRESVSQLVVYEKGLQLIGKGIDAPRDHVRIEHRIRPDKALKRRLPAMDLPSTWGLRDLPRAVLEMASGLAVDRFHVPELPTSEETRRAAFSQQWGAHCLRWYDADPAGFIAWLRDEQMARAALKIRPRVANG